MVCSLSGFYSVLFEQVLFLKTQVMILKSGNYIPLPMMVHDLLVWMSVAGKSSGITVTIVSAH
jgi:hypothetical protein